MNEYICTQPDEIIELQDMERDIQEVYMHSPLSPYPSSWDDTTSTIFAIRFHKVPVYFRKWIEERQGTGGDSFGYWVKIKTYKWETDDMTREERNTYQILKENEDLRSKLRSMLGSIEPYNMTPMVPNIHKGKSHENMEWEELFIIE